jgi:hypothetical protein
MINLLFQSTCASSKSRPCFFLFELLLRLSYSIFMVYVLYPFYSTSSLQTPDIHLDRTIWQGTWRFHYWNHISCFWANIYISTAVFWEISQHIAPISYDGKGPFLVCVTVSCFLYPQKVPIIQHPTQCHGKHCKTYMK